MNSELYGKEYIVPDDVLNHIQKQITIYPQGNGVRRAKFILRNKKITYQDMKRIKNLFDNFNQNNDKQEYELAGGDLMRNFIENKLNQDRKGVEISKDVKRDGEQDLNQEISLTESVEFDDKEAKKNVVAIIANNDSQILLVKRSDKADWQPSKWSLVGGGVEEGEEPVDACYREIKEEVGLHITKFSHRYIIQRSADNIEYIYLCKHNGENDDVKLDMVENVAYGWYLPQEIKFLDHVPNLMDYINLAFKDYE